MTAAPQSFQQNSESAPESLDRLIDACRGVPYLATSINETLVKAGLKLVDATAETRSCATCHAILADGPQPAATFASETTSVTPVKSMDIWQAYAAVQDEIASLRSLLKESEVRAAAYRDTMQALEKQMDASPTARAAVIEECAKAIENYDPDRNWSADEDMQNQAYFTGGEVQCEIIDLVRALAIQPATPATGGQHG